MRNSGLRILAFALAVVGALGGPTAASAGEGLVVGLADDGLKYEAARSAGAYRELGVGAVRVTVTWRGESALGGGEAAWVDRAVAGAGPAVRVVLSVYGAPTLTPLDASARDRYCAFVGSALRRYPSVRDVVVWNEVNKSHFWRPQFHADGSSAAPAAYAALLARCWDALHAVRADVNLLTSTSSRGNDNPKARSNISHSPGAFIRALGAAYRAGGRTRPLFDTVGHHPYGEHSAERPWRRHPLSTTIGQGDWDKLVQAYHDAFAGSGQPNPGRCVAGRCARIWWMEIGYQTSVTGRSGLYTGEETDDHVVAPGGIGDPPGSLPLDTTPAPDHGTQLAEAIRLAACQPYVGAYFNFLLRDEADLDRWQSGVLWADWTPKPSAGVLAATIAEVDGDRVDCERIGRLVLASAERGAGQSGTAKPGATQAGPGGAAGRSSRVLGTAFPAPRTDVPVLRVAWPAARQFNWRHDQWRFRVAAGEDVRYTARLRRIDGGAPARRTASEARGSLRLGFFSFVTFARRRLVPGAVYRIDVVLVSKASTGRMTRLVSPPLRVLARPRSS